MEKDPTNPAFHYHLGLAYSQTGDKAAARTALEQALAERSGGLYGIKASFLFAPLRGHPRFTALLKKLNTALTSRFLKFLEETAEKDAALYDTVRAVALELCPALGIGIPVGKDSLSMRTRWSVGGQTRQVTSPVSLIVSAKICEPPS